MWRATVTFSYEIDSNHQYNCIITGWLYFFLPLLCSNIIILNTIVIIIKVIWTLKKVKTHKKEKTKQSHASLETSARYLYKYAAGGRKIIIGWYSSATPHSTPSPVTEACILLLQKASHEHPKCLSIGKQLSKFWNILMMDYYAAIKWNLRQFEWHGKHWWYHIKQNTSIMGRPEGNKPKC